MNKKVVLFVLGILAAFVFAGCSNEPAADEYGGAVKDSGGKAPPPGKKNAMTPSTD